MSNSNRRAFLKTAASTVAIQKMATPQAVPSVPPERFVALTGDGVYLPPLAYARLLASLVGEDTKNDFYLTGGVVEDLEGRFANLLGKERALFLPTGTLANHIAVRLLAGERRHVLVQEESHLYRDEGDCAQAFSGLNLVPLAPGRATINATEILDAIEKAAALLIPFRWARYALNRPFVDGSARLSISWR